MAPTRRSRRRLAVVAALATSFVALSTGLAACAPGGGGGGGGQTSADPDGPVTIQWWDYFSPGASEDTLVGLLDEYQKEHPNVTIDRQFIAYADLKNSLLQSAGASSLPDVVVINSPDHQQFAELGIAANLDKDVADWGDLDKYPKGLIASATYNGSIYGLPNGANCLALFYDKKALADAGIKPPTTWEEMKTAAKALTTPDRYGFAYSAVNNQQAVFQWLPSLWQAGGDLTDLKSDQAAEALDYWAGLMDDGSVSKEALNWDQAAVASEFAQGRAAMMINGPWQLPFLAKEAPNLDYGVALLPNGKEDASVLGGENYMIIDGPQKAASWELIKWLQSPENVEKMITGTGSLPTRTDVNPYTDDPVMQTFTEQLQIAKPRAYGANYAEAADAVVSALQARMTGQATSKDALAAAADVVDPLLNQK